MKLLSPQEQKNEVNAKELQLKKKIEKLIEQQDSLIKRLNDFKDKETKEREKIKKEHGEFVDDLAAQVLAVKKIAASAESRKQEALRPIRETMEEARLRILMVVSRENEIERRERGFESTKQSILTLAETTKEKEKDLSEREKELRIKEKEFKARQIHYESFMQGKEDRIKAERDKLRKLNEQSNK